MIIKDKAIEPYEIHIDSLNHILWKKGVFGESSKKEGEGKMTKIGYYSTLAGALRKIIKERTEYVEQKDGTYIEEKDPQYKTIKGYIDWFAAEFERVTGKVKV